MSRRKKTLSLLLKYSLVEWQPVTRHYRLHDLARLFAAKHCTEMERAAGQQNHAEHYAAVLKNANDHYLEGGEAIQRGLALFDLEWGNIQAGQAWAQAHAEKNKVASQLCSGYAGQGSLLELLQHPRERIRWLKAALNSARNLKNRADEGLHLGNLGIAYKDLGEPRRAIEFYEKALVIDREIGDRRGEGNALWNMSLAQDKLGEREQAIANAEAALKIFEQIEDPNAAQVRRQLEKWRGK